MNGSEEFWVLSNTGVGKAERHGSRRWDLEVHIESDDWCSLCDGRPLKRFQQAVWLRAKQCDRREDFPSLSKGSMMVVSERTRALWEKRCSGNVEYLPVPIHLPNGEVLNEYYVANVLFKVDCIDREESEARGFGFPPGSGKFMRQVIDQTKVPEDVKIFRATTLSGYIYIRDNLRLEMEQWKLTGWFEYAT